MKITRRMVMDLKPCYSEQKIDEIAAGRDFVSHEDIAALYIRWEDKIWLLTRLMTSEKRGTYARRVALDVADFWDCPDITRRWLETGDESLREEAFEAAFEASEAAGSAERAAAAAIESSRAADIEPLFAERASWAAVEAALSAGLVNEKQLYLDWAVELLLEKQSEK